jgi:transcriptional regulator with XRE-family HTH domain
MPPMTRQREASAAGARRAQTKDGGDSTEVGPRLRQAREAHGLGLRELARKVEVSPSALSQIETGKTRPSVRTLYALTTELGLSMDELFAGEARRPAAAPVVQPLATRRSIELGAGVAWERLTAGEDPEVDFVEGHYAPGSSSGDGDGMTRHRGREYGVVTSGRLQLTVGAETHELGPGDSCCFDSREPHRLRNPGPEPARAFWFVLARRD